MRRSNEPPGRLVLLCMIGFGFTAFVVMGTGAGMIALAGRIKRAVLS